MLLRSQTLPFLLFQNLSQHFFHFHSASCALSFTLWSCSFLDFQTG